jgi:hypothetical protein
MSRFPDRAKLGFSKTRMAKQPMINDEAQVYFLTQLTAAQAEYPAERIVKFDESNERLVMASETSVADGVPKSSLDLREQIRQPGSFSSRSVQRTEASFH